MPICPNWISEVAVPGLVITELLTPPVTLQVATAGLVTVQVQEAVPEEKFPFATMFCPGRMMFTNTLRSSE